MVKVINTVPHHSVVKQAICRHCGATLEYVPKDIHTKRVSFMGEIDTQRYIDCPQCSHEVSVS